MDGRDRFAAVGAIHSSLSVGSGRVFHSPLTLRGAGLGRARALRTPSSTLAIAAPARTADGWQPWRDADIRIYASNRLRPNADIGGVVITTTIDVSNTNITYQPGQIRMPALWNRYGAANE